MWWIEVPSIWMAGMLANFKSKIARDSDELQWLSNPKFALSICPSSGEFRIRHTSLVSDEEVPALSRVPYER